LTDLVNLTAPAENSIAACHFTRTTTATGFKRHCAMPKKSSAAGIN